jgi:uncharacterized SAM-binding protein YcdF (DUF218 family)
MLYLAKILPTLVLPAGIAILLLVLSLALRKRALAAAALAVLWLSSTAVVGDVATRAAEGWQVCQPVSAAPGADAIVVLSGMMRIAPGPDAIPEWADAVDRLDAGVALALAGKAPILVFTSEWYPWDPDTLDKGAVLANRAVSLGVARDRILITRKVSNTAEEAKAAFDLLSSRSGARLPVSVILVTSAFHMRRSRLLFERAGLDVAPYPVDFQVSADGFSFMRLLPRADSMKSTETALREFYGYLYYSLLKKT